MVWSKKERAPAHAERSRSLTAAYRSPSGLPFMEDLRKNNIGSRGGAPIWVMSKAFIPPSHWTSNKDSDPDGFAVFGRYPKGFLAMIVREQWLGRISRHDILHVCSGTLGPSERWTVDLRPEAKPLVVASGTALPFRDDSFAAVMLDPPYSDEYARNLYNVENPRPSWLLKEAARVLKPNGRLGILHVAVPFSPPGCFLVTVLGVSTGVGFRIRAFTIYQKGDRVALCGQDRMQFSGATP